LAITAAARGIMPFLKNETKTCPACGKIILLEAVGCRYCGRVFNSEEIEQQIKNHFLDHSETAMDGLSPDLPVLVAFLKERNPKLGAIAEHILTGRNPDERRVCRFNAGNP
jgi:hypothetical protein